MFGIPATIEIQARAAARAFAFNLVGMILVLVGSGFLGAALWLVIEAEHGAIIANAAIGGLFVLLAGMCFLLSRSRVPVRRAAAATVAPAGATGHTSTIVGIIEGFAMGMQARAGGTGAAEPRPQPVNGLSRPISAGGWRGGSSRR